MIKRICKHCEREYKTFKSTNLFFCKNKCRQDYRIGKSYSQLYKDYSKMGFKRGDFNPMKDKKISKKVSLKLIGTHPSKETLVKMSQALKGKSYEQLMGKEKAEKLKAQRATQFLGRKHKLITRKIQSCKKQNIEIKDWKEFISKGEYDSDFNNDFRELIRRRDDRICMLCGTNEKFFNRNLDIHHINYDKKCSLQQNCISLCASCHRLTNFNRKSWIGFFQSILSDLYGYSYDENGIIQLNFESLEVKK